jgi:tetratricopeptide (TPR) repeat protein
MFTSPAHQSSCRRVSGGLQLSVACLFILLSLSLAKAQGVGSTRELSSSSSGIHTVQGKVFFPTGEPAKRVIVRLESPNFVSLSTQTNEDGEFRFNGLEAGNYTVKVDAGKEYEMAIERADLDREVSKSARTVMVPVYLRLKGGAASSAAFAGVPKAAVDLYNQAMESEKKNDTKKAIEQLSKAVELHPQFAIAVNELGVQYLKLGQADKAAEVLQRAVTLTPTEFFPHLNYGIALLNKKSFAEAETELRAALKINSQAPTAHMYLGMALLTLSRDEKTKQYDMAKYAEAQKEFEAAASSGKPEVAMAHRYLGGIYAGNKDYKRAADELEIYLKLSPKATDAERIKALVKDLRSK